MIRYLNQNNSDVHTLTKIKQSTTKIKTGIWDYKKFQILTF